MQEGLYIEDYVWGQVFFEESFREILGSITELKGKRQLGLIYRNPSFIGGRHTRYEHSIGTYHVACTLLKACEKFKAYFEISPKEKYAFKLSALLHDLGHGPCSHAFERISNVTHEVQTIIKVGTLREKIDGVFGEGVCDLVIQILENSYQIKSTQKGAQAGETPFSPERPNLLFVISELLSGAIDVDRMDYLSRDLQSVKGIKRDFTKIFDYMELTLVNDVPKIVFDEEAIPLLEDYFLTRFRNYNYIYLHKNNNILDQYFAWFIAENYKQSEISSEMEEYIIDKAIDNGPYKTVKAELSSCVLKGNVKSILYRSFKSKSEMEVFITKLNLIIEPDSYYYSQIERKVVIYDSKKNNVLIKSGDIVVDFFEASMIIKDKISQEIHSVFLDVNLYKEYQTSSKSNNEDILSKIKKLKKLFSDSNYEVEKKFIISDQETLRKLPNIIGDIVKPYQLSSIVNIDQYFEFTGMPKGVSIRRRNSKLVSRDNYEQFGLCPQDKNAELFEAEEPQYTLKLPAEDSTSLTKRQEHPFSNELSTTEFIRVTTEILKENGISVVGEIQEGTLVETERKRLNILINSSRLEVAIDDVKYHSGLKTIEDRMLEIELKSGNPLDIWYFIEQLRKKIDLLPCKDSKFSRSVVMLQE